MDGLRGYPERVTAVIDQRSVGTDLPLRDGVGAFPTPSAEGRTVMDTSDEGNLILEPRTDRDSWKTQPKMVSRHVPRNSGLVGSRITTLEKRYGIHLKVLDTSTRVLTARSAIFVEGTALALREFFHDLDHR